MATSIFWYEYQINIVGYRDYNQLVVINCTKRSKIKCWQHFNKNGLIYFPLVSKWISYILGYPQYTSQIMISNIYFIFCEKWSFEMVLVSLIS